MQAASHIRKPLHLRRKVRRGFAHAAVVLQASAKLSRHLSPSLPPSGLLHPASEVGGGSSEHLALDLHHQQALRALPTWARIKQRVLETHSIESSLVGVAGGTAGGDVNEAVAATVAGRRRSPLFALLSWTLHAPAMRRAAASAATDHLLASQFQLHHLEDHEGYQLVAPGVC